MVKKSKPTSTRVASRRADPYTYGVTAAVEMNNHQVPTIRSTKDGVIVRNTEIYMVPGFTAGAVVSAVTPFAPVGVNTPFLQTSWLRQIAAAYSMMRVRKAVISYIPRGPTTQAGDITIGVFYEYAEAAYWNDNIAGSTEFTPVA